MRGMILAAGLGTRLRPLTYEIPKPVVPVLGRPLCSYNMEFLRESGVGRFLLNLHHGPEVVRAKVAAWAAARDLPVEFTAEDEILGTGGALWNAREFLKAGTSVVANGDAIVVFPFPEALAFHRLRGAIATMVLFPDPEGRYSPVAVDDAGRLTGIGAGAPGGAARGFFTGVQIVEPEFLDRIPPGRPSCIVRETYAPLIDGKAPVFGFLTRGSFREFGTPADYLAGTLALLGSRKAPAETAIPASGSSGAIPPVFLGRDVVVPPGARIGPRAVVEEGALLGERCRIRDAVVWPGTRIARDAELSRAIATPAGIVSLPARTGPGQN